MCHRSECKTTKSLNFWQKIQEKNLCNSRLGKKNSRLGKVFIYFVEYLDKRYSSRMRREGKCNTMATDELNCITNEENTHTEVSREDKN